MVTYFYRFLLLITFSVFSQASFGQCPELAPVSPTPAFNCQNAPGNANLQPYFTACQTICFDNTGAGSSGQVSDLSCVGNTINDVYAYANNPNGTIPNYDGSLVFRWVDWPNADQGVLPPALAVHGEIEASVFGITVQSIDCQSAGQVSTDFALENALCVDSNEPGNQIYGPAGTIPTLGELDPLVDQLAGTDLDLQDLSLWLHMVTSDGATGPICFEISPYEPGYICGDATNVTLSGNSQTVSGSASGCLCESAIYGGLQNPVHNLPVPCGVESPGSAWYQIDAPFACNIITADVSAWGGSDNYNVAILSDVNCPGDNTTNAITGAPVFIPGFEMDQGSVIEASSCGSAAVTAFSLPAGTYYVYVSGETERPTFSLDITVEDGSANAGAASSPQNGSSSCSGGLFEVSTSGFNLPSSLNGQDIAWYFDENITFDPYSGEGIYAGSGTSNVMFNLPVNLGCTPLLYYVKGVVSDDGMSAGSTCQSTTNVLNVTVFPEIGNSTITNNPCIITVAGRCPTFTVNGNTGSDAYIATFNEDGNTVNFTVSNGLPGCNVIIPQTINCSGTCTQPAATANTVCDPNDPFNFYIDVIFTSGSATSYTIVSSDGGAFPVTGDGTFRIGPFANGNSISASIENTEDTNCNLPLGNFSDNCNPLVCPNLTSAIATLSGNACEGDLVLLQATIDQGIINQDFTVQWLLNGTPIPGANFLNYNYNLQTSQGCNPEVQMFSVELNCLVQNAAPSTTPSLGVNSGAITVYPIPQLGVDFFPDPAGCLVAPIDNCGNLSIFHTPTTDINLGDPPQQVSYTVSVAGAPSGCEATGTYTVQCIDCPNNAGNAILSADNIICPGESFNVETVGTILEPGYALGYTVTTTNPFGNLETTVVDALNGVGDIIGPFPATGPQSLVNGTDFGPGTYYFTPFVSLDLDNSSPIHTQSGSFTVNVFGSPTINVTIPDGAIPHCPGVTAYNIFFTINRTSGSSNSIDDVNGLVDYNGGSTANVSLENLNFTGDPNGGSITIEASNFDIFGGSSSFDWALTVDYAQSYNFPTLCTGCIEVGNASVYELLPDITLSSIPQPPVVCEGTLIDLTSINPTSNLQGSFDWYDADPDNGGSLVADPENVMATNGEDYWVVFSADVDPSCTAITSFTLNTTAEPQIAAPAQPGAICEGDEIDLTDFESEININSLPGTFTWFRGNPALPFAVQLTTASAMSQFPTDGTSYFAVFEESGACTATVSVTYTVNPLPQLSIVPDQVICENDIFDLTQLELIISGGQSGIFEWYAGNPDAGGVLIASPDMAQPDGNTDIFAVFTESTNGCSNQLSVSFAINPLPILNNPPPPSDLCEGEMVDLTDFESSFNPGGTTGNFVWYEGDPSNGILVSNPTSVIPVNGDIFTTVFTNPNNCSAEGSLSFVVNPQPVLTPVGIGPVCEGTAINLTGFETDFNGNGFSGAFEWYLGDPNAGGVVINMPSSYIPVSGEQVCAQFTTTDNCTTLECVTITVFESPILTAPVNLDPLCTGTEIDLTAIESEILASNQVGGSIEWYDGDPNGGGILINDPTIVIPVDADPYFLVFTSDDNCVDEISFDFEVYDAVTGITASYDCNSDQIVVDFSNATGGSGSGYTIAADSPNQAGESLSDGSSWTIIAEDDFGCRQEMEITGVVDCIICSAGSADPLADNQLCCDESAEITISNVVTDGAITVAWALTDFATGPVVDEAGLSAAADANNVFLSGENGSLTYNRSCISGEGILGNGEYYLTPVLVEDPDVDSLIYDPDNNCIPLAEFETEITSPDPDNWAIAPFIINRPDGSIYNVNDSIAFGLPLTQQLIDLVGGLPPINLVDLYDGNPNGTWGVTLTNTGTAEFTFTVPDFQAIVSADSCSSITEDQVTDIAGFMGTVQPGETLNLIFEIPPSPPGFPSVDSGCASFGIPVLIELFDDSSGPPCVVSIEEVIRENSLMVFPNPSSGFIEVSYDLLSSEDVSYHVTNVLGQQLYNTNQKRLRGLVNDQLDLTHLSTGVYFLTIRIGEEKITERILISR
ncbi:MAG: T9SS type A sorting domain-containing protein [Bacteroidota bacterium]